MADGYCGGVDNTMKLVFSYEVMDTSRLQRTAKELRVSISSFRHFGNTFPIVVLSNNPSIFDLVRGMEGVTFQKTDYASLWRDWDFLPRGGEWWDHTFSKLFINEIMGGEEFFYSDTDMLFLGKLQEQKYDSEKIAAFQSFPKGSIVWMSSGFMHFPTNSGFGKEVCRGILSEPEKPIEHPYFNRGDEYFYTKSGMVYKPELLSANRVLHPECVSDYSLVKQLKRTGYLAIHLLHKDSYPSTYAKSAIKHVQSRFL